MLDDQHDAAAPADRPTELAWLLRRALAAHRAAIARSLRAGGHERLPPLALWAIDVLAGGERSAGELVLELGVTKQAVSQMVELLVTSGYVDRMPDSQDRRRVTLALTDRGRGAAAAIASACASVEERALAALGPAALQQARGALRAFAQRPAG
jgi:DNA-binding MarR family transcriptional regulator